jgi:hypothetical protein
VIERWPPASTFDARRRWKMASTAYLAAILSGTPAAPRLTGSPDRIAAWQGPVSLIAARRSAWSFVYPEVARPVARPAAAIERIGQMLTAQAGADAAVPADDAARRHGPVQPRRGKGQQDHRDPGRRHPDGRGVPGQAVRHAGRVDGRHRGVGAVRAALFIAAGQACPIWPHRQWAGRCSSPGRRLLRDGVSAAGIAVPRDRFDGKRPCAKCRRCRCRSR